MLFPFKTGLKRVSGALAGVGAAGAQLAERPAAPEVRDAGDGALAG